MSHLKLIERKYNFIEIEMTEEDKLLDELRSNPKIIILEDYKNSIIDDEIFNDYY